MLNALALEQFSFGFPYMLSKSIKTPSKIQKNPKKFQRKSKKTFKNPKKTKKQRGTNAPSLDSVLDPLCIFGFFLIFEGFFLEFLWIFFGFFLDFWRCFWYFLVNGVTVQWICDSEARFLMASYWNLTKSSHGAPRKARFLLLSH